MNMNRDAENFEQLRRLLALKRHEQPPPGYFNGFSRQVIVRIRSGDGAEEAAGLARLLEEVPWLRWLWAAFQTKPILAGAFGALVCGGLISVVISWEKSDVPDNLSGPTLEAKPVLLRPAPTVAGDSILDQAEGVSSTDPIIITPQRPALLFDVQSVNYPVSNGN